MEPLELAVERRAKTGKGSAHKTRARGLAPGVVYGQDIQPIPISFTPAAVKTVMKSPYGINQLIRVVVDSGEQTVALIKHLQIDPLSRKIIHGDFVAVADGRQQLFLVPLRLEGKPEGVKAGGFLKQSVRALTVKCLPKDIPLAINLDVSALGIGDSIHVNEVTTPDGCKLVFGANFPVAAVSN